MKLNSKLSLGLLTLLSLPGVGHAATCGYASEATTIDSVKYSKGALIPCGNANLTDVSSIVLSVTRWVLDFAGAIAVLFIIFGGIQYITSAGNEKQAEAAKQTLTYAVIGIIVILLATVIITLISNTLAHL